MSLYFVQAHVHFFTFYYHGNQTRYFLNHIGNAPSAPFFQHHQSCRTSLTANGSPPVRLTAFVMKLEHNVNTDNRVRADYAAQIDSLNKALQASQQQSAQAQEMPCFGGFSENVIMQDFWISMYLANMAAIAKNEADEKIKAERADSQNKYDYQANVNTVIGSLRDRLAEAVFSRNPLQRELKLLRIITEIQKSVVPIRPDDGKTPRYENPRKSRFHRNKKSNLWRLLA